MHISVTVLICENLKTVMPGLLSLDMAANDFFRKFYTKTFAYRLYRDEDRNTNTYNRIIYDWIKWACILGGRGGLRERMNIGRETAHRSNKFMLSWCTTQYTRWFTSEAGDWEREHVIICIHTSTGTQLTSHVYPSACSEQADGTAWILLQHYKRLAGWLADWYFIAFS